VLFGLIELLAEIGVGLLEQVTEFAKLIMRREHRRGA